MKHITKFFIYIILVLFGVSKSLSQTIMIVHPDNPIVRARGTEIKKYIWDR